MVEQIREPIRDENAELLKKLREDSLRQVVDNGTDAVDQFHVPEELKPEGFTVEWKVTHVMGQELDAAYKASIEQAGWVPAPASIFRKMLPIGSKAKTIERGGQILMMRPKEITDKRRQKEKENASGQVQSKLKSIGMTKEGTMDRKVIVAKKSYEAMEIPD